jgi:hypothetical protein
MMYTIVWLSACQAPSGDPRDPGPADTSDPGSPVEPPPTPPTDPTDPPTTPVGTTPEPTDPGPLTALTCFGGQWGAEPPVDYDQFGLTMGSHCQGTDHQDIQGVERVVFVGDSHHRRDAAHAHRAVVAQPASLIALVRQFRPRLPQHRLARTPTSSTASTFEMFSGDFASCAKYGARTDDLLRDPHRQLETCIPEEERDKVTLVVMSIGGNDIYSACWRTATAGVDDETLQPSTRRDAATPSCATPSEWLVEPGRFPNGVYVVMADTYDFTDPDGADDMAECPGAELIRMDRALRDPLWCRASSRTRRRSTCGSRSRRAPTWRSSARCSVATATASTTRTAAATAVRAPTCTWTSRVSTPTRRATTPSPRCS